MLNVMLAIIVVVFNIVIRVISISVIGKIGLKTKSSELSFTM